MPAAGTFDIVDARAVAFAELARDIEAEPGAVRLGGEERLEEVGLRLARHSRPLLHDVEREAPGLRRGRDHDAHRAGELAPPAPGVAPHVPPHPVHVLAGAP